jgi:hypothetical protein
MAPTPRLTSVFVEASLHAWKNLGLDAETKKWIEESFDPETSYLLAIIFIPWIKAEYQQRYEDYGSVSWSIAWQYAWDNDPHVLYPIEQALYNKTDPRLPGILKSDAHRIAKMTTEQATEYFADLATRVKTPEPEGYKGEPFVQSLDGWSWVKLGEQDCRDHEGALMQHCGQAMAGDMVSLRDPNGKPHITAELDTDQLPWRFYQFKGKQNNAPAKQYWKYALDLFQQIARETGQRAEFYENYADSSDPDGFMGEVIRRGMVKIRKPNYGEVPANDPFGPFDPNF